MLSTAENRTWWQACERAGIERIGLGDTPALARELYVSLTDCALTTERIGIMPSVTNPVSRDPAVTAAALYSLAELAPGRLCALGIGTGDSALWGTGIRMASVGVLREYILAVRGLLQGKEVAYQERRFRAAWASAPVDIPIYVACAGPKVLHMAAQVADGLILAMGYAPENLEFVHETILAACAEIGRDPADLDLWWNASAQFAGSVDEALEAGVQLGASWLTAGGAQGKQIPDRYRAPLIEFTRDAHDLEFMYRTPDRNTILMQRARALGIYDWLLERTARLWGTPADIARRLRELRSLGLDNWVFTTGINNIRAIEELTGEVMPLLAEA
ncbi:MAG TPA: LLM class flavin-dependent oxidoreductase [Dehalococcoidia bacterium]|nr:LLM class flavin-dependent oxidoreductase [Dehalococcoidia bacterium]